MNLKQLRTIEFIKKRREENALFRLQSAYRSLDAAQQNEIERKRSLHNAKTIKQSEGTVATNRLVSTIAYPEDIEHWRLRLEAHLSQVNSCRQSVQSALEQKVSCESEVKRSRTQRTQAAGETRKMNLLIESVHELDALHSEAKENELIDEFVETRRKRL